MEATTAPAPTGAETDMALDEKLAIINQKVSEAVGGLAAHQETTAPFTCPIDPQERAQCDACQ